jgi:dihydropteroate synthase
MSGSLQLSKHLKSAAVMGIINLSPDSFYDQSRCPSLEESLRTAERMVREGAGFLDIGAESSRPGSKPVSEDLELQRLLPVVSECVKRFDIPISVDTYKPAVVKQVLQEGASIINDITGLQRTPETAEIIARNGAGVIVMHMQGTPETMQDNPDYNDIMGEINQYLAKSIEIAETAGIDPADIVIDPGIGFGKTVDHNLKIVQNLELLQKLRRPVLLGVSRKSFVGQVLNLPIEERLEGVMKGARIIRTHDVLATRRAVQMTQAILNVNQVLI